MAAMYGDVKVEFQVSGEGASGDVTWTTGDNRRLYVVDPETGEQVDGHHDYISTVAVLRREDLVSYN